VPLPEHEITCPGLRLSGKKKSQATNASGKFGARVTWFSILAKRATGFPFAMIAVAANCFIAAICS